MSGRNHFGYAGHFFVVIIFLVTLNPDILPQSNNKVINWPEPVFEHITVEDGLPINSVPCMIQDHFGYLWLGTTNGLVKYDGYNMKIYQPNPGDSFSISGQMIRSLYEDKKGTLWIGTRFGGLNSFDRKTEEFTRYDTASISNSFVYCIDEDRDGNILTGTMNGLKLLDRHTKKFRDIYYQTLKYSDSTYNYLHYLKKSNSTISTILKVGDNETLTRNFSVRRKTVVAVVIMGELKCDYGWLVNANGKIIAGGYNSLNVLAGGVPKNRINITIDTLNKGYYSLHYKSDGSYSYNSWDLPPPDHKEFWGIQVIGLPEDGTDVKKNFESKITEEKTQWIRDIIKDRNTNTIYVGSYKVFKYDEEKKLLVPVDLGLEQDFGLMNKFCQEKDGSLLIGHVGGLLRFIPSTDKVKNYQPEVSIHPSYMQNFITNLVGDKNGFVWCTQYLKGLVCFDPKEELFKSYEHDPQRTSSISNNQVVSLLVDRSGVLWVGTAAGGLNKWDKKKNKFRRISYDTEDPKRKPFDEIYAMYEDQNEVIWFGTDKGLLSFNPQLNQFHKYRYDAKTEDDHIDCIYSENPNIIWLGTTTKGLGKFNRLQNEFKFYSKDPKDSNSISGNNVTTILPDSNNTLWVGTSENGLNRFDENTGKFITYNYEADNPQGIGSDFIDCIYRDRSGTMWIATNFEGLNKYDRSKETFEVFHCTMGTALNSLETIYEDKKGNFWVGTYQSGIHLFDRDEGVPVMNISQRDGLAFNSVSSILEDNSGKLWIATKNGLSKFDIQKHNIKNYFISDSPKSNDYLCGIKTKKGEMVFGTGNGLVMFYPDSVNDDPVPPQVVISNVSLFNKPGEKIKYGGFISELKELSLSYDQNDLRFDFVGLHYGDPEKNRYKYMLENFDADWVNAGTQRNATYTNLDAGEYTFRVTACNSDGVWNKNGAAIKIIIPPPFWETWWAYALYVLLGAGLLYSIRRYEMNRT